MSEETSGSASQTEEPDSQAEPAPGAARAKGQASGASRAEEPASGTSTAKHASRRVGGVRMSEVVAVMVVLACVVSGLFLQAVQKTNETYQALSDETEIYIECELAASSMKEASNYLTAQLRQFVITHDVQYLDNYFVEVQQTKRRDSALDQLESLAGSSEAHNFLERANDLSNELMGLEHEAAQLVLSATNTSANIGNDELAKAPLSAEDAALSSEQKLDKAMSLMFGENYQAHVDEIERNIAQCKTTLIATIQDEQVKSSAELESLLAMQQVLTWALLAVVLLTALSIIMLLLWPIRKHIEYVGDNQQLPLIGARELRFMASEYNTLYEENLKHSDSLRRKAEHDHLTGLYNRSVFEHLLEAYRDEEYALLLIDADYFKDVNDTLGHDAGDKILQKLSRLLAKAFRSSDYACRLGGDEFAVVVTDISPELVHVIDAKIKAVADGMADDSDGLPKLTLSVGAAFSNASKDADTIYKHADEALYFVKNSGRNGLAFYGISTQGRDLYALDWPSN